MKTPVRYISILLVLISTLNAQLSTVHAQGTAFTYQGRLNNGASPASGNYDLTFTLFATNSTGVAIAGPVTNAATAVTNGLFTVTLDFGSGLFAGSTNRWLEIGVRTNGNGSFTTLSPRQQITPTPYAIFANTASNLSGTLSPSQLSGTIPLGQLPGAVVTNNEGNVNLNGSFTGNGSGLAGLNASNLTGVVSDFQLSTNVAMLRVPGAFTFNPVQQYGGGAFVTAVDLNNDSNVDLIAVDSGGGTVSTLINNGNGGFTLTSIVSAGPGADSIAVADIYGDGKPAVVSANSGNGTLTILTNIGSGSFQLIGSVTVGGSPFSVIAADVNGDGKPDLVSANNNNTLAVLTNDGTGTFTLEQAPDVGDSAIFVTAADVNGDHKIDLICARQFNYLVVLTNNGSGLFTLAQTLPAVTGYPVAATAADVNGDGKVDLITADGGGNTLSVLTNNGSGLFALAQLAPAGSGLRWVTAADINGDGYVDLIGASFNDNTLSVLTNNGRGSFALAQTESGGSSPRFVMAADVNRDGRMDLISGNSGDGTLSVLFGTTVPNVPLFNANQTFTGANAFTNAGNVFVGDGSGLTGLNASQLTSGTIPNARLSGTYLGVLTFNNPGNSFSGNGANLTSLNANNLSSGTVPLARLPAPVVTNNESGVTLNNLNLNSTNALGASFYAQGNRTNGWQNSVGWFENTNTTTNASPALRVFVDSGARTPDGALSVSANVTATAPNSLIAEFGNSSAFVVTITNDGTIYSKGLALTSDRNAKANFRSLDGETILAKVVAMPVTEWNYKEDGPAKSHIGPVAQDFHEAFGLNGGDDTHISVVDEGGVALAAIQGLNQKLTGELEQKETEITGLKQRLAVLEKIIRNQKSN